MVSSKLKNWLNLNQYIEKEYIGKLGFAYSDNSYFHFISNEELINNTQKYIDEIKKYKSDRSLYFFPWDDDDGVPVYTPRSTTDTNRADGWNNPWVNPNDNKSSVEPKECYLHHWVDYIGFTEKYQYCQKCGKKSSEVVKIW